MKTSEIDGYIDSDFEIIINEKDCNFDNSWVKIISDIGREINDFEKQLMKDTFNKYFGLQSCLKSVRTQGDAIVALSEKTGLRIEFIKSNLEQIINL